jgi:anthranilate phosphoribosyltransferase
LLDVRWVIGLRNPGHTVAKLLDPGEGLRVVNYTHPEYGALLTQFLQATAAHAMLLRGTEGEPFADPRRTPRMDVFLSGRRLGAWSQPAQDGVLDGVPPLPVGRDARATAAYIQDVLDGRMPAPDPLRQQVWALQRAAQSFCQPEESGHAATHSP